MSKAQRKNQPNQPQSMNGYLADVLDDGQMHVRIVGADGQERRAQLDVLVAKLACEETEAKHRLEQREGRLVPTAAFLTDLANAMHPLCGVAISPSVAFQLWIAVDARMAALQKKMLGTRM